ncbi:MAG: O-antigen polymerase [Candidatus Dormibacteraceae bacterium]
MIAKLVLLRNWYIAYVVFVFIVGGHLLWPHPDALVIDAVLYIAVFLLGYRLWGRRRLTSNLPRARTRLVVLIRLLVILILARLGLVAYQVLFVYGFTSYVAGGALVGQIQSYGRVDVSTGWYVVISNVLDLSTIAACAYYVRECLARRYTPSLRLIAGLVVGVPILELQRSSVLFGIAFLSVTYIFTARIRGEKVGSKVVVAALAAVLALGAATYVGLLRQAALAPASVSGRLGTRAFSLVESEMSPILVYATFRSDVGRVINYQYGGPILGPLAFKLVPRNWYPNKPTNSAAFYALYYEPAAFASGFAIAPTLWGALYLNFGYLGTVLGSFLLGVLTARLDRIYLEGRVEEIGWLLIFYYNYYSLLRDDISNVLSVLLITGVVFMVIQWTLRARPRTIPAHSHSLSSDSEIRVP